MKSIALTLFICMGNIPLALADDSVAAAVAPPVSHTIMGGVIKSVSKADPAKDIESEIVVVDAAKKKLNILITPTTTLWDYEAKAIELDKIVPKRRVNVIYLPTAEGVNIAKSIKILK